MQKIFKRVQKVCSTKSVVSSFTVFIDLEAKDVGAVWGLQ